MEAEFPAIVVNDDSTPKDALQCKSQVSIPVNDEIDFRISFDESDDEDYTIICDKNSFSYKMISVNNLKTDSENNYEKVMPSIPSPEPAVSCFDDLDFFKDFENEFPAIVYNDAQTSKSDLLTEPILNPQHINKFDLSDETSLSEYDEEEQNIWLFHHVSRDTNFRYEGLEYTDSDIADFESRLERIYTREIHKVHVVDFQVMPELLRDELFARMAMEHRDKAGVVVFREVLLDLDAPGTIQFQLGGAKRCLSYRQFILALGLHTEEEMESPDFARDLVLRLCHRMMAHSIAGRSQAPKKVAMGPERQTDAAASALVVAEDAPAIDEGDQAILAPVQAPQQPPLPPPAPTKTMP
ncbi:hypothetical protein Tco_1208531 [Tanacetum coccineum]